MAVHGYLKEDIEVICRPYFEHSPNQESPYPNRSRFHPFLYEQAADQEAAENKEQIDSHPAHVLGCGQDLLDRMVHVLPGHRMVVNDEQDGEPAHEIELNDTWAQAGRGRTSLIARRQHGKSHNSSAEFKTADELAISWVKTCLSQSVAPGVRCDFNRSTNNDLG